MLFRSFRLARVRSLAERGDALLFRANDAVEPDIGIIRRPLVSLDGDARRQAIRFRVITWDTGDANGLTI